VEEKTIENKAETPEKKRRKLDATGVLNLLSYPAALASGAAAAWQYIRQESFEVLRRWEKLKEPFGKDGKSFDNYASELIDNIKITDHDAHEKLAQARKKIEVKKEELFESAGLKPIHKRLKILAKNNKFEALGWFVGGATVTLGAYLILANSKDIVGSFFVKGDEKEEKEREKSFVASLTDPKAAALQGVSTER
jgi:hypothetical protein